MSSKRALRRRACKGKVRFETMADALAEIRRVRARGARGYWNAYGCSFCGGYHAGHTPGKVRRAIAARRSAA